MKQKLLSILLVLSMLLVWLPTSALAADPVDAAAAEADELTEALQSELASLQAASETAALSEEDEAAIAQLQEDAAALAAESPADSDSGSAAAYTTASVQTSAMYLAHYLNTQPDKEINMTETYTEDNGAVDKYTTVIKLDTDQSTINFVEGLYSDGTLSNTLIFAINYKTGELANDGLIVGANYTLHVKYYCVKLNRSTYTSDTTLNFTIAAEDGWEFSVKVLNNSLNSLFNALMKYPFKAWVRLMNNNGLNINLYNLGFTAYDSNTYSDPTPTHTWDAGVTSGNVKTYTCTLCGATKTETVQAACTHTWDAGTVTTAATCVNAGVKTYTCTLCSTTRTEAIPATGVHTWDAGTNTTAATCSKDGVKTYTCSVCSTTKTEAIPATGKHTWNKGVLTTKATETQDGLVTYTCTSCGTTRTTTLPAGGSPFVDVQDSSAYYYTSVLWAVAQGITAGTSDFTFSPANTCTRAQVVTFLYRAAGSPSVSAENPFTDVKKTDYYYNAVLWAVKNGITSGTTKTTFGPNENCTRAQVVTFLYRAAGSPKVDAENPFTDVKQGDYYYNAVLWAVKNGITSGTTKTTFGPGENCTRGQVACFLYRYADSQKAA